jgi:hypothetical protein
MLVSFYSCLIFSCFVRVRSVSKESDLFFVLYLFCSVSVSWFFRRLFPAMILFCIFCLCPLFCSFMGYATVFWVLWVLAAYVLVLYRRRFCQGEGGEAMW